MKKILSLLSLAVLTVGLLGSCSKINERLDNLEKKVDGIENEQIASINTQITNINSSIADLGQIRSDITSLKQSAENHGQEIFDLQEADEALGDRIANLEDYLDDVLPTFAETEWVKATFSTLEQYEATCDTIAKIEARIGTTSEKLSKDIKACADSLTKWVNKTFEGYYTAAQMDAKLTQMKAAIDSAKSAGGITDAKADSIASELTNAKAAVDTAKANIRKEYRAAIDTAIKTSEGKLTKALQEKITEVNGKIESLTTRVGKLETSVADLTGRIIALEKMIQTVTIVPAYSDGSVKVEDDTLFIDLSVTPKEAVATLGKDGVKILLNRVQTKAVVLDTVPTDSIKFFKTYKENGTVSIKAHIKKFLAELGEESLTVAVNVRKDKSDYTTEFVPVTLPISVSLDKHSIVVPFSTTSRDTTLTVTVENSTKGVTWTSSNTNIATVDANGKVTINADASGKDTIVVKTVEGNATDTCFITVLPEGALAGGFTVNAEGKKVHFSQGNLWYGKVGDAQTATFQFENKQYEFHGYDSGNDIWGLFGWVGASSTTFNSSPEIYGVSTSTTEADYGNSATDALKKDWGTAIDDKDTWRTLSKDEWTYLFNTRTASKVSDTENARFAKATVNSIKGVILLPDTYTHPEEVTPLTNINIKTVAFTVNSYDSANWAKMESAGAVFLPTAGSRNSSDVSLVDSDGYYWSSSAKAESTAYYVTFYSNTVNPNGTGNRRFGYSVRLVTEVK